MKDLRSGREKFFKFPDKCPGCKEKLVNLKDKVAWRCVNKDCPVRKAELLEHFISKKAFNIDGLGQKIIAQLLNGGIVSGPVDIFNLKESDLLPLERFGEKSAKNLIAEIGKSKKISLDHFIYALGIRHVGEETARDLADSFRDIERLKSASIEALSAVSDVGIKASSTIYDWFRQSKNMELIAKLKDKGIKIVAPKTLDSRAKLKGKSFVITGSLISMPRDRVYQLIRDNGGEALNSLSKNTDFLIKGENPGEKLGKAKKMGKKIIDEQEFLKIIND